MPDLDVAENVYLHREPRRARLFLDSARLHAQCRAYLEELGIDIDPRARVSTLSVAQQQLVEIAKALSRDAEVVIFDEPTASLTSVEQDHLFSLIRRLRDRGTAIAYVSHRLDEIFAICDVVTVLKDGRLVRTMPADDLDHHTLVSLMVGRDLVEELYPPRRPAPLTMARPCCGSSTRPAQDASKASLWRSGQARSSGWPGSSALGGPPCCGPSSGPTRAPARQLTVGGAEVGHSPQAAIAAGIAFVTGGPQVGRAGHRPHQPRQPRVDDAAGRRLALQRLSVAAHRDRGSRRASGSIRRSSTSAHEPCPAATSRRSWWASGWPSSRVCCSAMSPPGASTWAPRRRSTACCAGWRTPAWASCLPARSCRRILGIADRVLVMRDGRLIAEFADRVPTEEQVMRAAAMDQMEVTA